ncbi:hypothetical protein BX600DRAFT_441970 [Xylariales sp. PMI_506]|nr:hypothetical protein BX600DRAFT_441970 [Xylariales sp. PMI_506]
MLQSLIPARGALLFGAIFTLSGAGAVLAPWPTLAAVFKFTPPTTAAEGERLASSLSRMYGIRDVYAGLLILALSYRGDYELLGWSLMMASVVACVDGYAARVQLGRRDWSHWFVASVLAGLGAALAGYLG